MSSETASMSRKSVVIRFLPVDAEDEFGLRMVTLTPDSDTLEVGRASKREAKNLLPRPTNALFDSRVMSRSHAKLHAVFDPKKVNLRDGASTHGTWLNGEKLSIGKDYTIVNGDLVAFGTEVIRGRDSFRPLKFRLEYSWMESSPSCVESVPTTAQKPVQPTNTFCVPDNDDESDAAEDDIDHTHEAESGFESDEYSENPPGGITDSEDMSVVEVPSPFTRPPNFDQHELTGTQHSPIDLDSEEELQPLATPRMTPPSPAPNRIIISSNGEESKDINNETDQGNQPMAPSMTQAPPVSQLFEVAAMQYDVESDGDSYEPSESSYSDESVSDSDDSEEDEANMGANSQFEAVINTEPEPQLEPEVEPAYMNSLQHYPSMAINGEGHQEANANPYIAPTMLPCREPVSQHSFGALGFSDAAHDSRVATSSVHLPSPAQLLGHPLDAFRPTSLSSMTSGSSHPLGFKAYRPAMSIPPPWRPCGPASTYTDGPFVNDRPSFIAPRDVSMEPALVDADESAPKQPQQPVETVTPTHPETASTSSNPKPSLKRKAEMVDATEPVSMTFFSSDKQPDTISDDEESLPDAQPLDLFKVIGDSGSQVSGGMQSVNDSLVVESVQETVPVVERPVVQRPAKRMRTSGPSNLRTHATTAVIGAMVGAVGTVALLASLPQDYFL